MIPVLSPCFLDHTFIDLCICIYGISSAIAFIDLCACMYIIMHVYAYSGTYYFIIIVYEFH